MAIVRPFKGVRPNPGLEEKVACLPYDVMNRAEAKKMAEGNPHSYLHVCRSEIDLEDSVEAYSPLVYETARKNLDKMQKDGTLIQDDKPVYYIYRQLMNGRVQTGIVATVSIDEYQNDIIKKHEFTRPEKEVDRINNFDVCEAHTEPVFLSYRRSDEINLIVNDWIKFHMPTYNFNSVDGITHILWPVDDLTVVDRLQGLFGGIKYLYIADGHHRSASSVKVGLKRREENPNFTGEEEFNFFMAVIFPDEDLFIMDYNRLVKDLNGYTKVEFLDKIEEKFTIEKKGSAEPFKPMARHTFGMFLEGEWYKLTIKKGFFNPADPVECLDVSILQRNLLEPILGIVNPRTDKRIDFVGGIRGLKELERRCSLDMKVALSMYPTTMDDLLSIADAGEVMPPKSTWFEPKLASGLFLHKMND